MAIDALRDEVGIQFVPQPLVSYVVAAELPALAAGSAFESVPAEDSESDRRAKKTKTELTKNWRQLERSTDTWEMRLLSILKKVLCVSRSGKNYSRTV